ncbi:hypothetical protein F4859DRAFT_521703 [Xylaria cf. heliscus]|nr:hypothetical protein F4859DRAFT_521703 [Xylaria cf. heliscus]
MATDSNVDPSPPKNVIIVGGSLSGLMHGVMLHRLGSRVSVLEQSTTDTPPSHMAGVCLGPDVLRLLNRFDGVAEIPLGIPSVQLQSLDQQGKDLLDGGREMQAEADLVLGADGPNSIIRRIFCATGQADRKYSGYVAWRGVVPEKAVSEETRRIFRENITYSSLRGQGGHVIVYNIPGKSGSIEPGDRLLNFCWYTNVPVSSLADIMTDVDGKLHHTKLPPGKVHPEVWKKQRAYAETLFAPAYLEVIQEIASPFVHLITDFCSPRAAFSGGKVLMVGDASTLLRPHIAFSTNQAAYHALLTEKLVTGRITAEEWEYQVTTAAHFHWRRSVWFGEYFQQPFHVSMVSAVLFWATFALVKVRTWAGWLPEQAV